jgi:hypothetical protein
VQRFGQGTARGLAQSKRAGHGPQHLGRLAHLGQVHKAGAVFKVIAQRVGQLQRQARLADARRTDERQGAHRRLL